MHSYREHPARQMWVVYFQGDRVTDIRGFDQEWKAALYTSFLNGGSIPSVNWLTEMFPSLKGKG
jgi:hypothetical protein